MNRSTNTESTVKAQNLQVGQYMWYAMLWREIVSLDTIAVMDTLEPRAVVVRFRGDAGNSVSLNANDSYQVRRMVT